jgi:FkbM family methyltransferase
MTDDITLTRYGLFRRTSKRRIYLAYDSEEAEVDVFHRLAQFLKAEVMLDIGANIGLYCINALSIPEIKRVVAVEASSETYAELSANLALQNTDQVIEAHNIAASTEERVMRFYEYGSMAGHNGLVDTSFVGERLDHAVVEVAARPMDLVVPQRGEVLAVKIDVEGHECEVLDGARDLLAGATGFLQIEIVSDANVTEVTDRLSALGYDPVGFIKCDHYYLHRSLADQADAVRKIMFDAIKASLASLLELRRMRRSALRAARKVGPAAAPVTQVDRFARDPVMGGKARGKLGASE